METQQVIETRGVRKTFRDFWRRPMVEAVKGLNLSVARGEVFGLLGPNGSGKSTTLKMLLGLLRPSAGTIRVLCAPPQSLRARARIGYLPEISHLHPFLTPRETLRYYASLFGLGRRETERRTAELLEMVDLTQAADRAVGRFSKGMARRVGLAQALVNAPELLILDEPTSGLDPVGARAVKDLVRTLAGTGVTVLMTSHLLADVEDVCDRVAILDRGALRAEGRTGELLRQPDAVRFEIEGVDDAAAGEARGALEARFGRPVRQSYPSLTLESYFLQVVADGRTSGAFRLAPFLLSPQPDPEPSGGAPCATA
ncbi:MAG: ABC transporter ATP-binding protein [Kiritimatiellia bacterium]|jgi:ABC-2 type transport system ATP-binding protein|nr:ABC transporter ATP-binding protein [Kiritimatiellia bacterium]